MFTIQVQLPEGRDDALIGSLARQGIPYVPFFPLGGFTPLQSSTLSTVAERLETTPMQVALAWLLHRSPNILLIPGTSSRTHLRENLAAAELTLPADALAELDGIAANLKSRTSPMPPAAPLTRDRILAAAEDVIRRHGPPRRPSDVARWASATRRSTNVATSPARSGRRPVGRSNVPRWAIVASLAGPERLRKLIDALIAVKRRRASGFRAVHPYRTLGPMPVRRRRPCGQMVI